MTKEEIVKRIKQVSNRIQHENSYRSEPTPVALAMKEAAEKCQDKISDNTRH